MREQQWKVVPGPGQVRGLTSGKGLFHHNTLVRNEGYTWQHWMQDITAIRFQMCSKIITIYSFLSMSCSLSACDFGRGEVCIHLEAGSQEVLKEVSSSKISFAFSGHSPVLWSSPPTDRKWTVLFVIRRRAAVLQWNQVQPSVKTWPSLS